MKYNGLLTISTNFEALAKKKSWSKKPKGWDTKSVKQYSKSMMAGEKHPFTECVKKMKGKVDDPKSFCGSVKSIYKKK